MERELYCLCGKNYYKNNEYSNGKAMTVEPMTCIKTGATRVLENGSLHYPNVDVFECKECGSKVCR